MTHVDHVRIETRPTTNERLGCECVKYKILPIDCLYNVASTEGVVQVEYNTTPD